MTSTVAGSLALVSFPDPFKNSFTFKGIQDWNRSQSDVRTTINYRKHLYMDCNARLVTVFLMFVFTIDIVWSFGLYISIYM